MPPKGSRKVTSKQSKSAKKKAPRTPLPSVPAPPKITLKLTPRASSTPQLSLPSEPLIIQSPSPPQIEVWVVELEIKCYLDGERITSTLGRVTNDPYGGGSTYSSIKQNAEEVADRLIEIRGISNLRRDHICWYGTYGAVNNPSEVDIANEGDFDHVVARVRNSGTKGKDKLLKLQICFGIVLQPSTMVRPPWKDAPVVKAPIIAIPKRVYNEETSPATTAKKPRTATTRLLEDEEKKREAEKGTLQEVITSIQVHWICRVDSCTSLTKFC
ncbi:hypothetical protein BKA64DRAFT_366605 [Cadophora sp. MPI-SDFR-AT-0126]|nr:hypothetical protein BKA64DRAFT_366605 [Leotiomycetes sp. MPI-SDFR-AT-0126]